MPSQQTPHRARLEAAQQINSETASIQLSAADQLALVEAIMNPPEPNEALRKAADAYKGLVIESR
ncbi:DUF1778 domain-containing protein [Mesorhizobium captivum]|uniref:DUF1778 domain-containing protein n=1 Tax=Mesorhizobium captivum TaxID=3072319 RepID=A0ABU4YSS6_9HYPH|nr:MULTISPECIES: DUF1778 domain-containing protein [unclassified Mesorhizobium]MDX8490016.1 DUF1778 domain-containing protein [Mesorhizobium sp. VK22B]MDX8508293.1 DUF1778 domain-containing protein [Mesorhizobium sp. VK22E]MDX8514698.1 DUF1778 domain-containing protein [Mesorhizobium sp. VK23E]